MPIITIRHYFPCAAQDIKRLAEAASASLATAFAHSEENITVRIEEYTEDHFYFAIAREMPSIQIEVLCFPGRSREQKQAFYDNTMAACMEILGRPVRLLTIFTESPKENWIGMPQRS